MPFGTPLGIENGVIPDTALTSSTCHSAPYCAQYSRLNSTTAWVPLTSNQDEWLQVNLNSSHVITSIITRGRSDLNQWMTSYTVSYSRDSLTWSQYLDVYSGAVKVTNVYLWSWARVIPCPKILKNNLNYLTILQGPKCPCKLISAPIGPSKVLMVLFSLFHYFGCADSTIPTKRVREKNKVYIQFW